jgi:Lon protease-like protein
VVSDPFPERLAIFPLPNIVLFPGALLPLHIFEERYRRMTSDALAGDRSIGMVLLRPDAATDEDPPAVFPVGCLGRITRANRLKDGRYLIILRGESRFRIRSEIACDLPYRIVSGIPFDDRSRLGEDAEGRLHAECGLVESVFLSIAGRSRPEAVAELRNWIRQSDPLDFVHTVAFGLDLTPVEKQSVLEQDDPVERARTLRLLLEFRRAELSLAAGPRNSN